MPEQFDTHNATPAFDHDSTLVVALELSGKSWQAGAVVPGVARRPRRRLEPRDMTGLLKAIDRWTAAAAAAGRAVRRVALTYEAGRDGFWIARDLLARGIAVEVEHPASVPVERPGRRVKTDRIDLDMLLRTFLAWLRGEPRVCSMVRIPSEAEEEAPAGTGARASGRRAPAAREPHREPVVSAWDRRVPAALEKGDRTARRAARLCRHAAAGQDDGRAAAADGAAPSARRTAPGDRGRARSGGDGDATGPGRADDPASRPDCRPRPGDRHRAGPRDVLPAVPRPSGRRQFRLSHRHAVPQRRHRARAGDRQDRSGRSQTSCKPAPIGGAAA